MMILRPMLTEEYPGYLEYFIADYAREIASNYSLSSEDALARATQEIAGSLPEGVNTPGQILLCLMNAEQHVGYLWYKPDTVMQTVFIYDFHIFSEFQGLGMGKAALHTFEQCLQEQGVKQIRLRVAGDNSRAQRLYEVSGFGVTGINMSKTITTPHINALGLKD